MTYFRWLAVIFIAMLISFQNCSKMSPFEPVNQPIASVALESSTCTAGTTISCAVTNGVGAGTCGDSICTTVSCNSGFTLNSGVCTQNVCTPGSQIACSTSQGTGLETCDAAGVSFESCILNSCNTGYKLVSGTCVATECLPAATQSCMWPNGNGSQTCSSSGSWGLCTASTCDPGFILSNNTCLQGPCTAGTTSTCSTIDGSGNETCSAQGVWGSCLLTACNPGGQLVNGVCVVQSCTANATQSCSTSNGTGLQICAADGSAWGACQLSSCNNGFTLTTDGQCVASGCTPGTQTACIFGNGAGVATCNAQGTALGSCVLTACATGYTLSGGLCVQQIACTGSYSGTYINNTISMTIPTVNSDGTFTGTQSLWHSAFGGPAQQSLAITGSCSNGTIQFTTVLNSLGSCQITGTYSTTTGTLNLTVPATTACNGGLNALTLQLTQ